MAEVNIMSSAQIFGIGKYNPHPWICRDDNGDYWTVIRDTSDYLKVFKSTDSGSTWVLKKTLTNSDWTGGNPLPTANFQIINLSGLDKVYLFLTDSSYHMYGWIFNVTAGTDQKDLDYATPFSCSYEEIHASWDAFNSRLLYYYGRSYLEGEGRIGKINLDTTKTGESADNNDGRPLSYYVNGTDGYGYTLGESLTNERIILSKKKNGTIDYYQDLDSVNIPVTKADLLFANVVCDSAGNPVVGYVDANLGIPQFVIEKKDKTNLATSLISSSQNIASGSNPESCFITLDGNNNIYFIYTDGSDKEAYYVKYDASASTWGSPVKISSDNDGKLIMPELKPPIADNKVLVTYQATA